MSHAMRCSAVAFLLATLAAAASCGDPTEDAAREFLAAAQRYAEGFRAGNATVAGDAAARMRQLAEGPLRSDPRAMVIAVQCQGRVLVLRTRYADAEALLKWTHDTARRSLGPDDADTATSAMFLGEIYVATGRYAEAEPLYRQALATLEKIHGRENLTVANNLNSLGLLLTKLARYAEAERCLKQALAVRERLLGPRHVDVGASLSLLANVYSHQGRFDDAVAVGKRSVDVLEATQGPEHVDVAAALSSLGASCREAGDLAAAERYVRRGMAIYSRNRPEYAEWMATLNNLAVVYQQLGRYGEAEPLLAQAVEETEKRLGAEHPMLANCLNNQAMFYDELGRYGEAEPLMKRALTIREKTLPAGHSDIALVRNNLAVFYHRYGRYAEAEKLLRGVLADWQRLLGTEHPLVAMALNNLALVYHGQGREAEAETLQKQALALRTKLLPADHHDQADTWNNLAAIYEAEQRFDEAQRALEKALPIWEKSLGPQSIRLAFGLNSLAYFHARQKQSDNAERLYRRALAIQEQALGADHPDVAMTLLNLADLDWERNRLASARSQLDRAIDILDRESMEPRRRAACYWLRARIAWKEDRRAEAIADLSHALDLVDQLRRQVSGAEQQRAEFFGQFTHFFEKMVAWRAALGDTAGALAAMERSRARSLADQLETQGLDLLIGVPAAEAARLRAAEQEAREQVAALERQCQALAQRRDLSEAERRAAREALELRLESARRAYARAYADIRNASPAYQLALGKDLRPASVSEIQAWADKHQALVLEYCIGGDAGHLLALAGQGPPRLVELTVGVQQATDLHGDAGPLHAARLARMLANQEGGGLLQRLRQAATEEQVKAVEPGLAALWTVLIPGEIAGEVLAGKYKRLVIVPDAELAQLPFETLVVQRGAKPRYLLDVGPAVAYAPSATILLNLAGRKGQSRDDGREPVLTVGNPTYTQASGSGDPPSLEQLASRSRYNLAGGKLPPLPFTAWETDWVRNLFKDNGLSVRQLKGPEATKVAVRELAPGRQILHLACHGLVDQMHGNLFGSLALTPGASSGSSADDGFLTLADIYKLNLSGCEMAVLSACETNLGPQQQGEGTWALSRGFLVAGARRVAASNWLVDDEAGASLVSYFCSGVAQTVSEPAPDYALALHKAKLWIRGQEKWSAPYFWGAFVLVGP